MPESEPGRTQSSGSQPLGGSLGESPPFAVADHTLIRRIGKGAYGEVWLARNALGAWRAVKFIRRTSFDDDRPFEREFAGIQRFEPISRSHESQLNILHVGRAEDGFYYVMELADDMGRGQEIDEATYTPRNLRSELHLHGRLPATECLRIGLALTTALEHLHKHGLVHRDIKPSNIVFVHGIPKLADIGLVARAEATASFVGTEGFLPPEGPGTRQADIFSLGKVLYEISTGHDRNQFPELPTNIVDIPDRTELSELNEVLLKACHRDPRERYQSAAEMHAELALLESGRSVVRLRGIERRLRFVQRAGATVTGLAVLIAAGWWWQARQTQLVRRLAAENSRLLKQERAEHDRASRSEQDAHRVLEFLLRRVVAAARPPDEDGEGMGRDISVLHALQAAEPAIAEAFGGQSQAELELRTSLADTFNLLGVATNEVAHRQRALALSETLFGRASPETLTNRMQLAWAMQFAGLTNEYLALLEQAWQTASNALGARDERTLMALAYLGVGYRDLHRGDDAVRLLETGAQLCRETFGQEDLRTVDMVNHLAWTYYGTGQPERAWPLLAQTLATRESSLGRDHPETTRAMIDLGRVYQAVGREPEAFALLEEAYQIRRRQQGQQHRDTLIAIDALARTCELTGRTNEALNWYTLALGIREAKLGTNQPGTLVTRDAILRLRAGLGSATNSTNRAEP